RSPSIPPSRDATPPPWRSSGAIARSPSARSRRRRRRSGAASERRAARDALLRVELLQLGAARVRVADERVEAVHEDTDGVVGLDPGDAVVLLPGQDVVRRGLRRVDDRERELTAVHDERRVVGLPLLRREAVARRELADLPVDGEAVDEDARPERRRDDEE